MLKNIDIYCEAVENSINAFTSSGKSGHAHVVRFQTYVFNYLETKAKGYKWVMEKIHKTIQVDDRVDIFGESISNGANVVIEIDGWRADQVAKKFLSRVVLYSLNGQKTKSTKPIDYIAILYPQSSSSLKESLKYIKYANVVLKSLNKDSTCSAIVFNPKNCNIIKYQPEDKHYFNVTVTDAVTNTVVSSTKTTGLTETAEECISQYLNLNSKTYNDLKVIFGPFVSSRPNSRARLSNQKTSNEKTFYINTQWRGFGPQSNWHKFLGMLPKNIVVEELYNFYKLGTSKGDWYELTKL